MEKEINEENKSSEINEKSKKDLEPDTAGRDDENNPSSSQEVLDVEHDKDDITQNAPVTHDTEEDDDDEGIDVSDGHDLDGDGRNKLFERGVEYEKANKLKSAMKCYMTCLQGLKPDSNFPLLPQCLRNIADIFYKREEYDKAIHFIQAEKVYYESALIDTTDIQKKLEEAQMDQELPQDVTEDTVRADEFEELARICLDKKQPQLALEYAGKATKIRQNALGDGHPVTVRSLDFFTQVYAEAGADQYQDNMKKFESGGDETMTKVGISPDKEPQSILRKRKPGQTTGEKDKEKKVHFDESIPYNEDEEKCARMILWILFAICGVILLILGTYLYCHISTSSTCTAFKYHLKSIWDKTKYYYYHYTQSKLKKFV